MAKPSARDAAEAVSETCDTAQDSFGGLRPYDQAFSDFRTYHKEPVNVALHGVTTPLILVGVFGIAHAIGHDFLAVCVTAGYLVSLSMHLPLLTGILTVCLTTLCHLLAVYLDLSVWACLSLSIVNYFGQDLAHWTCGEPTFESTYVKTTGPGKFVEFLRPGHTQSMFLEHLYFLVPMVIDALLEDFDGSIFVPQDRIVHENLTSQEKNIHDVFKWVKAREDQLNPRETKHWYNVELPDEIRPQVEEITTCDQIVNMFGRIFPLDRYDVKPVWGMNEVYVGSKLGFGSDAVFYTKHIDGPWGMLPGVSLFRTLVGCNANSEIHTLFPEMRRPEGSDLKQTHDFVIDRLDILGFDYNRETHWIQRHKDTPNDDYRITLKLHYIVFPKHFNKYGWLAGQLNVIYNTIARALFNATKNPDDRLGKVGGQGIVDITKFVELTARHCGIFNVGYVLFVTIAAWLWGDWRIRFVATSFVHYCIYISTWYYRKTRNVNFHRFKRNAFFFKQVFLVQNVLYMLSHWAEFLQPVRFAMVAGGYTLTALAYKALGKDRTYFGSELGLLKPKWITEFPYGTVPQPMIVGQLFALLAMASAPCYLYELGMPWFIPLHMILYTTHMLQEMYDVHEKPSTEATGTDANNAETET